MIFPALVFLGLKNNDCCGCCGNESCGKRFAVSERKRSKNSKSYMLSRLWDTKQAQTAGCQSRAAPLMCHGYTPALPRTAITALLWSRVKWILERAAFHVAQCDSSPFQILEAVSKSIFTVVHCVPSSLQTCARGCVYLIGFTKTSGWNRPWEVTQPNLLLRAVRHCWEVSDTFRRQ